MSEDSADERWVGDVGNDTKLSAAERAQGDIDFEYALEALGPGERRGSMRITQRRKESLDEKPARIDIKLLDRYPEFVEFRTPKKKRNDAMGNLAAHVSLASDVDPEEQLESAHQTIQTQLASDVLETVKACSPAFFEQLVVDLIVGMGYRGSHKEAGEAAGGSGDGGIDGIIKEDRVSMQFISKLNAGKEQSADRRFRNSQERFRDFEPGKVSSSPHRLSVARPPHTQAISTPKSS